MKKGIKRDISITLLTLLLLTSFASFVIAEGETAEQLAAEAGETAGKGVRSVINFFGPLVKNVFFYGSTEYLTRIYFSIIIFLAVWTGVSFGFKGINPLIQGGVSFAVTALAMIAIPADFIAAIRDGYGALGGTILMAIPFIIIFAWSMKTNSLVAARIIWICYVIYYFALYLYVIVARFGSEINELSDLFTIPAAIPYIFAIVIGAAVVGLIPWIRHLLFNAELAGADENAMRRIDKTRQLFDIEEIERNVRTEETGGGS